MKLRTPMTAVAIGVAAAVLADGADAQLRDVKEKMTLPQANHADGIRKNVPEQIGAGRGNAFTQNSSTYVILRDPFRSVRRGRQLFQRKFLPTQGFSGRDRAGNIHLDPSIGAGVVDSCAGCHGRPRGSAGHGGDVFTRPDSRDAPHLFGLGLIEQLADEMTTELRAQRDAMAVGTSRTLTAKGINFGVIRRTGSTTFDTSQVVGVDPDLRVRPFFAHGGTISIREFAVGAFNAEMGLQSDDPDLVAAAINRQRVVTPSGMVLDGSRDAIESPPVTGSNGVDPDGDGIANEMPVALVDHMEFYLLHYFKAATNPGVDSTQTTEINNGRALFNSIGCASCHVPELTINRDRRIADVDTTFNPAQGNPFNRLFATATAFPVTIDDAVADPPIKTFAGNPAFAQSASAPPRAFVVRNFFADLKRHDLGDNFAERNHDNRTQARRLFMTEALWGVGTTAPYGHDGRTHNLEEVIRRHATVPNGTPSEANAAATSFINLTRSNKNQLIAFLNSLILFSPDDTASNLQGLNLTPPPQVPGAVAQPFPQAGHGAIALTVLFNNPADVE